jgi:hypothetical protein
VKRDIQPSNYQVYSVDELKYLWDYGAAFAGLKSNFILRNGPVSEGVKKFFVAISGEGKKKVMWDFVNPYGDFRTTARNALRLTSLDLAGKISKILDGGAGQQLSEEGKKHLLLSGIRNAFPSQVEDGLVDHKMIENIYSKPMIEIFESMSAEQTETMLATWLDTLSNHDLRQRIEGASMHSLARSFVDAQSRTQIDLEAKGFIAVVTNDVIKVDGNLFAQTGLESFAKVDVSIHAPGGQPADGDTSVKIKAKGFVAVISNDMVTVRASLGTSMGTAGFVEAMKNFLVTDHQ